MGLVFRPHLVQPTHQAGVPAQLQPAFDALQHGGLALLLEPVTHSRRQGSRQRLGRAQPDALGSNAAA
jgi:hypothetical protein